MKSIVILMALSLFSFIPDKGNESAKQKKLFQVPLYWFNTSGSYLRTNTLDDEILYTGYNNVTSNPKTLRELGYQAANCTGTPPAVQPIDPNSPDETLYSHP